MVYQEPASITLKTNGVRFTIFKEPRFEIIGEIKHTGELFLHSSPIKSWSKSCYLSFLEAMNIVKEQALLNDFKEVYAFCPMRKLKFISMMGFHLLNTYTVDDEPWVLGCQKTGLL